MAERQNLTNREIVLSVVAGTLLLVLALVGYSSSFKSTTASVIIAQGDNDRVSEANRVYSEKEKNLKNWNNEYSKYSLKFPTVDGSKAKSLINQYASVLNEGRTLIDSGEIDGWWDKNRDLDSSFSDVQDALQVYRDEDEWKNVLSSCKNMTREINKELASQVKNRKKEFSKFKNLTPDEQTKVNNFLATVDSKYSALVQAFSLMDPYCVRKEGRPNDFWNDNRDVEDAKRDVYDLLGNETNELSNTLNCKDQLTRDLKNQDKNVFNEYKRIVKKLKGASVPQDIETAYQGYVGAFTNAQQQLDAGQCEDARGSLQEAWNTYQQDFWTAVQGYSEGEHKAIDLKNVTRDLQQKKKELSRMKLDLKRVKKTYDRAVKKYVDVSDRKAILLEFATLVTQAQDLINSVEGILSQAEKDAPEDPQSYWATYQDDLNDLQNNINEIQQRGRAIGEVMQEVKNVESELARRGKDLKRFDDEQLRNTLQDLLNQGREQLQSIWATLASDPESARQTLQSIYDLNRDWDDAINDWNDQKNNNGDDEGGWGATPTATWGE